MLVGRNLSLLYMSCSLNSFKGYIGDYIREHYSAYQGGY